ncbi:MAG: HAMP domain-containing sensor histidine kinase [Gemmatimonadota bacterium]
MTVRRRLVFTLLGIAVLLTIPAAYSASQLSQLQEITERLRGRHAAAYLALGRLQRSVAELDRSLRGYVAAPDPTLRDEVAEYLAEASVHLGSLDELGYSADASASAERVAGIERSTTTIRRLVEDGDFREATAELDDVKPALAMTMDSLNALAGAIDRRARDDVLRAERISAAAATTVLVTLIGALAVVALLGAWTTSALTTPLRHLQAATAKVIDGRFEVPDDLPYGRTDEIGDLSRAFRTMTGRLAELERVRAEFIGMASHDLKTPINVISGYAELLETGMYGEIPDPQREILHTMQEQSRQLGALVNQLLIASRIEAGGFEIHIADVALNDMFEGVRRSFSALAAQKGIELVVDLREDCPTKISGDADRLRNEVLGNLLSNAFKFTSEGGRVELTAEPEGDMVRISVKDTGVGIPAHEVAHIFDKYYQVGREARRLGSGLGLAIARQVVTAHGGSIGVESEEGGGTCFSLEIPVRQPHGTVRTEPMIANGADHALPPQTPKGARG